MAMPHLNALLFQLRRAFAGDVLANLFPRVVVTGENDGNARVAERSADRAAGRYIVDFLSAVSTIGSLVGCHACQKPGV